MGANYGGQDLPMWRRGQTLLAADLNRLSAAIVRRLVGGPGVLVRAGAGQVVISLARQARPGRGSAEVILAELGAHQGAGVYEWAEAFGGTRSGTATELNLSTDIVSGTKVPLHRGKDGALHFFFPVEDC